MERKPILLVGFDGVLHRYNSGWQGIDIVADPPVEGAKEFLTEAVKHFRVSVYSSRSQDSKGRTAMRTWCRDQFGRELTEELRFPPTKPAAFLAIDGRCVCFDGTWPSMRELREFKPWNKRGGHDG